MQSKARIFEDVAKVASGAAGALGAMRGEMRAQLRGQVERLLSRMDLVTREEFEAVEAMAAKARAENETLAARVAALEAALPGARAKKAPKSARKAKSAKKPAKKASSGKKPHKQAKSRGAA